MKLVEADTSLSTFDDFLFFAGNFFSDHPECELFLCENVQPACSTKEYLYILENYYSHLKEFKIITNDLYYYSLLKHLEFNVKRAFWGYDVNGVVESNQDLSWDLDCVEQKFLFLSRNRHDHKYQLRKFLDQNPDVLYNTIYSWENGNAFYKLYNKYLGLEEHKYQYFPPTYQGRSTGVSDLWDISLQKKSAVIINTETAFHGHGPYYSEKTLKCLVAGRPFITVGAPGAIEDLHRLGLQTFDDLIDESYDTVMDPGVRMKKIQEQIIKVNNLSLDELKNYIVKSERKLTKNFEVAIRMYSTMQRHNLQYYPLPDAKSLYMG